MAKNTITVKLLGDNKDLKRALDESESGISGFGKKAGKGFKVAALGAAGVGAAAVAFGPDLLNASAKLDSLQVKSETVFGKSLTSVEKWAEGVAGSMGLTESQVTGAAAGLGDLLKPMGFTSKEAANMSTEMLDLSGALSAWTGGTRDATEVSAILAKAMLGEREGLKELGISISEADVQARLAQKGQEDLTGAALQQAKALATQELVVEKSKDAQEAWANGSMDAVKSQNEAMASVENLKESFVRGITPALESALPVITSVASSVGDVLGRAFEVIGNVVQWVRDDLQRAMPIFVGVGAVVVAAFTAWAISAGAAAAATIAAAAPFIAIGAAIAAVAAGFTWAYQNVEWFRDAVDAVRDWMVNTLWPAMQVVWEGIVATITTAVNVARRVIETVVGVIQSLWAAFGDEIVATAKFVWGLVSTYVETYIAVVRRVIEAGVAAAKIAWNVIEDVYTFFRDNVFTPVSEKVGALKDAVVTAFTDAVELGKTAWKVIRDVYTFFRDNVFTPVKDKVTDLKDAVVDAFETAVDAVKVAWDTLKSVVKTPINVVIGFYNNGIRKVWNAVIAKIPGVGELGEIARLNRGGWVPGSGNRDTVPAMLTPGEFVITKDAAKSLGARTLHALNKGGTLDPGVFGYAEGGFVSMEKAQAWARAQVGKPYRFPMVGPDAYDCSGLTSALINFILGRNPYSRRHSTGTVHTDPALAPGRGDGSGLLIGARPPYMRNSLGAFVGHMAATLGGVPFEATPPAVRYGGNARGASSFPNVYHMPGFGSLTDAEKKMAKDVAALRDSRLSGGLPPLGDLLYKMVNRLPGMIYDFLIKGLPGLIVNAIKDVATSAVGAVRDLFTTDLQGAISVERRHSGGFVGSPFGPPRDIPIMAQQGEYVMSRDDVARGRGGPLIGTMNVYDTRDLNRELRRIQALQAQVAA